MPAGLWISFGAIWAVGIVAVIFLEMNRRILRKEREREAKQSPGDVRRDT